MSVAISTVESGHDYDFWRWLSEYAELPNAPTEKQPQQLPGRPKEVAQIARARIWAGADKKIRDAVSTVLANCEKSGASGTLRHWELPIACVLEHDPLLTRLPTKDGVVAAIERLEDWWTDYYGSFGKSGDAEMSFALTEDMAELELGDVVNRSERNLAVVGFLRRLRDQFPGTALTTVELQAIKYKRRVRAIGERFAHGFSDELRSQFFHELDRMADGYLIVPCNGDAKAEANLITEVWAKNRLDRCRIAAAILLTAQAIYQESPRVAGLQTHPIYGFELAADGEWSALPGKVRAVAPGFWRLAIEGEQFIITCALWPRPVVMSSSEFGRARGSANAILRCVGIAVDSPPGLWKAVWESHGLRNQLLATAERIDPRVRIEEFRAWLHRIALAAPAADRPPIDGAAVRLADGATVASRKWLIGQALADGVIRQHDDSLFERTLRQNARETNRRDANRVQQRLLTIDAVAEPAEIPLIYSRDSARIENREEA